METGKAYYFVFFLLALSPSFLLAQEKDQQALFDKGFELFHDRKYEEAKEVLEAVVKLNPENFEAYLLLGEIGKKEQDWQEAKDWYDAIVQKQANHIEAHYQLGICDREDGIGRDPLLRTIMWRNSRTHFTTVILLDSTYKQVHYEYALLKRYQNEFKEAIDLCLKQLAISPDNREAQLGIFTFYDLFLTYGGDSFENVFKNKTDIQLDWLKNRFSPYDLFFIAEKLRRTNQLSKADSVFKILEYRRLPFSKVPLYLAQVRLYNQMGQFELAEKTYYKAINSITNTTDINFIFEDVKYILTDSDLRTHFNSLDDIKNYYRALWNKKNPLNSTVINYRLAEHYKRLIEAEKEFRYDGFRLPIHNPDRTHTLQFPAIFYNNSKFNHKGMVYLRFGPPDDKAIQTDSNLPNNESWLYHETSQHPKLIFHFEVHEQGPPGDWRLVPVPSNQRMLEARLGWDRKLDQYYMAENQIDMASVANEIQLESVSNVRRAMLSERHTWDKELAPLALSTSATRFLDDKGQAELEVYIGIPREDLLKNHTLSDTGFIETGIALQDTTWRTVFKQHHEIPIASLDSNSFYFDTYIDIFPAKIALNKFYLASHVRDLKEQRLGGNRIELDLNPLNPDQLTVSDLLLAYSIQPTTDPAKYFRHGLEVIPNPSKRFKKSDLIYFYYEIYNLMVVDGQARYKIEQTVRSLQQDKNIVQKFLGLFGGGKGQTISISKEHQNEGPIAYEFTAMDFSNFSGGTVELTIKIRDLQTDATSQTKTTLDLF